MANAANVTAPLGAVSVLRVVDFALNMKSNILSWKETRATRRALDGLTDAQLDDIGLTRADIKNV